MSAHSINKSNTNPVQLPIPFPVAAASRACSPLGLGLGAARCVRVVVVRLAVRAAVLLVPAQRVVFAQRRGTQVLLHILLLRAEPLQHLRGAADTSGDPTGRVSWLLRRPQAITRCECADSILLNGTLKKKKKTLAVQTRKYDR